MLGLCALGTKLSVAVTVTGLFVVLVEISKDTQFYQFTFNSRNEYVTQMELAKKHVHAFLSTNSSKFITLQLPSCGGLCNMFYRYLSIYGIGRSIGRKPFIDEKVKCFRQTMPEFLYALPNLHKALKFMKPNGKRAVSFGMNCCRYDNVTRLGKYKNEEFLYVKGTLLQAYKYFHAYKWEIRYLLEFSDQVKRPVDEYANELFGTDSSHKLCVHTRLGDFKIHFLLESTLNFTESALQIVAFDLFKTHKNISLILLGMDTNFTNKIEIPEDLFNKKYIPQLMNRTSDLYFGSRYCDSLLITASGSTFAWWMAYLMPEHKQHQIYYNVETAKRVDFGKNLFDFDSFPHEWKRLRLLSNGSVNFEPRWHFQMGKH